MLAQLVAINTAEAVTWGDILLILGIIALIVVILAFMPRFRR